MLNVFKFDKLSVFSRNGDVPEDQIVGDGFWLPHKRFTCGVDCEDKIDRLVGLNKLMREVWLDCYNIIYVVLLYQSIDGEKRERYNIISVVINRPLPWRVRLHGRSKPHLIKSSIFWVLGGDGPAFFSILGFWAGLLPCVRVFIFFFFFFNLSLKSQKDSKTF